MVFGKHFTKYYFKYLILFLLGIIALIVVDRAQLKIPEVVGNIIDGIEAGEKGLSLAITKDMLSSYMNTILLVAAFIFVFRFLWRVCIFGAANQIQYDIRDEMFKHLEKMGSIYFEKNKTGSLMNLFTSDLEQIKESFGSGTLMLVDALSLGSMAIINMIKISPLLTIICVVPLSFIGVFSLLMRRKVSKLQAINLQTFADLSDFVQEDYTGINVVKAFARENRKRFLFGNLNDIDLKASYKKVKVSVIINVVINGGLFLTMFIIVIVGGLLLNKYKLNGTNSDFTVGKLVEFNAYFDSIIWPVMAIADLVNMRARSKASQDRVCALLDTTPEILDNEETDYSLEVNDFKGNIKFNHLNFQYPSSDHLNLKDISFNIKAGEFIGLMGSTGCGKSTIVELLTRIYNIEKNKVFIDGHDLMTLPVKTLRDIVAYVPQESFLFMDSIKNNIAFSKDEPVLEDVINAAISSDVDKDIENFPDKYDTLLGERGVTVSGGQRQRIAIARALLKDAPILLLDDSLSAVDTITESYILTRLRELRKGKTTIIIAHRITTLETLDRIIVMKKACIDDIGTHDELLSRCDIYKNEVHLQELEKEHTEKVSMGE